MAAAAILIVVPSLYSQFGAVNWYHTNRTVGLVRSRKDTTVVDGVVLNADAGAKCLSLDFKEKLDAIISDSRQVFITMPAKAAGTSLKTFTAQCTKEPGEDPNKIFNNPEFSKKFLTDSLQISPIITAHLAGDQNLINLLKHSTRQTLVIYVHRDESERLLSAIKHILNTRVCGNHELPAGPLKNARISKNATQCIVDEKSAVELIENRIAEVGLGGPSILTCDLYDAIEQNEPNMIFLNYKQANKLQKLLAKRFCPELMEEPPTQMNLADKKGMEVYLRMQKGGDVKLDEWLHEKSDILEWSLRMKEHATCQAKTRHMEDDLFTCSDLTIKVSSADIKHW